MATKLQPGDRVMIEIRSSEVYEGTVEYISARSLELYEIFCHSTSTHYDGSMTFYRNEVVTILQINKETQVPKVENAEVPKVENAEVPKKIALDPDELHRLKEMTFNFIFVDSFGKSFDDAVEVLSNRESIAVAEIGSTFGRRGLSLLLMSDFKQVYIFDMFCLVRLRSLENILESSFITKVVHDGALLYDCLYNKYKVKMQNVFDTKVVDTMISSQEGNHVERNISQCLTHYFNFPASFLSAAMEDIGDKIWLERPVMKSNKIKASQLVTYILTLRDKLMSHILKPYSDSIQKIYTEFHNKTEFELRESKH